VPDFLLGTGTREEEWEEPLRLSPWWRSGEAAQAVAREDAVFCEPALFHFQGKRDVGEGAWDGFFVMGLEIVDFHDDAGGIDVGNREGKDGVFHPEGGAAWRGHDEEHAAIRGEFLAKHQAHDLLPGFIRNLGGDGFSSNPKLDGGEGRLGGILRLRGCEDQQGGEVEPTVHEKKNSRFSLRAEMSFSDGTNFMKFLPFQRKKQLPLEILIIAF